MTAHLPFPVLESDVRNIIYANWIVPLTTVEYLIPPGVEVVEIEGETILTVLTYSHGHFGPSIAGIFRRFFPSPLQSNWRLYVKAIAGTAPTSPTVLFLANIFDSGLYAVGTRVFSDVMLSHRAMQFEHRRTGNAWITRVSGNGSAPSWEMRTLETVEAGLPSAFAAFFLDYTEALRSLCLQDAAIAPIPDIKKLAISEIELPIDIRSATPLLVETYSPGSLLKRLGATSRPFCFRVPNVTFRVLSEKPMKP